MLLPIPALLSLSQSCVLLGGCFGLNLCYKHWLLLTNFNGISLLFVFHSLISSGAPFFFFHFQLLFFPFFLWSLKIITFILVSIQVSIQVSWFEVGFFTVSAAACSNLILVSLVCALMEFPDSCFMNFFLFNPSVIIRKKNKKFSCSILLANSLFNWLVA